MGNPSAANASVQSWMQDTLAEGFKALKENNPKKASLCCQKVLKAKPDLVAGHFLVGLVAQAMNNRKMAIHAFGSVTTLDKTHAAGWAHLAKELMDAGQINRADKALNEAVKYESGEHLIQNIMGSLFTQFGDYQSAEHWQEKALAEMPDNIPYIVNYVNSLLYLGKTQDFESRLSTVFEQVPGHAQSHFLLSTSRKATSHHHIEELDNLLTRENISPMDNAFLHYALGKELEDMEEWDRAFTAFEQGAKARRSILKYDEQRQIAAFDTLTNVYTADWLAAQEPGCEDSSPIFVLGQPRTGTTLVERIITSHSSVHSAGELQQFSMSLRRMLNYKDPQWFTADFMQRAAGLNAEALGEMYLHTSTTMRGTAPHFVDKMPPNFYYIPLILKALPNAKIVHLKRNPMDACFASYKQLFADAYAHSYDQQEMARHHARYFHLMDTWRERFPGRFFDIAYEDVASDAESHARQLIDYLGLPWEDACLNFHQQKTAVATASAVQVREPAHTRSIDRWKRYENQLEPMLETLKQEGIDV